MMSHIFWPFLTYQSTLSYSIPSHFGGYLGWTLLSTLISDVINGHFLISNLINLRSVCSIVFFLKFYILRRPQKFEKIYQFHSTLFMFVSLHFGIFVFLYFGHFSFMIFFMMCSVCLFFLVPCKINKRLHTIFVTSLTKTKNKKWNEIIISKFKRRWEIFVAFSEYINFLYVFGSKVYLARQNKITLIQK